MKDSQKHRLGSTKIAFQTAAPNTFLSQGGTRVPATYRKIRLNLVLLEEISKLKKNAEKPLTHLPIPKLARFGKRPDFSEFFLLDNLP